MGDFLNFMRVRNGEQFQPYAFQPLLSWGHNIWNHATPELVETPQVCRHRYARVAGQAQIAAHAACAHTAWPRSLG